MCERERDGAERERMRARGVRMSDAMWTAGDEESGERQARGCGVALMGETAACGDGRENLVEGRGKMSWGVGNKTGKAGEPSYATNERSDGGQ